MKHAFSLQRILEDESILVSPPNSENGSILAVVEKDSILT